MSGFFLPLLGAFLASEANAATWTMCSTGCDFADFDSVENDPYVLSGDVIQITEPGDYDADMDLNDPRVLTFEATGAADRSNVNLYGSGSGGSILDIHGGAHLTLRNVTVDGDLVGTDNRCILVRDATTLVLEDVTVRDCDRNVTGAGMRAEGSTQVWITDSLFDNNYSGDQDGGAILAQGQLTIENTSFTGNSVHNNDGGAIYCGGCTLTVSDADPVGSPSGFYGNLVEYEGGAIAVSATGSYAISDVEFVTNTANHGGNGRGGALALRGGGSVTDCTFTDNHAGEEGGAIFVTNAAADLTLSGGAIQGSALTDHADMGGGLSQSGGVVDILGTTFQDLYATDIGGAIQVSAGDFTVDGATFHQNHADAGNGDGGAIRESTAGLFEIHGSTFTSNTCSDDGIVRMTAGSQTLTNNWFQDNTCVSGCGIMPESTTSDTGSTYINNDASSFGGAIVTRNGPVTIDISDAYFEGNDAGNGDGGAIRLDDPGIATLTNVTMVDSFASQDGGHLFVDTPSDGSATLNLVDCTFETGESNSHGGAIYTWRDVTVNVTDSQFVGNTSHLAGGAIRFYPQNNGATLSVSGSTFQGNIADQDTNDTGNGGAIWLSGDGLISLLDNAFWGNVAEDGGALFWDTSVNDFQLVRNDFCDNAADDEGGAVYMNSAGSNAPRVFENNLFRENLSGLAGGALYVTNSTIDAINNHFVGNTSSNSQGALRVNSTGGLFVNNLLSHNTGGAYYGSSLTTTRDYNGWFGNTVGDITANGGSTWDIFYGTGDVIGFDPLLETYSPGDGDCGNDLLTYDPYSPMLDAGDPTICDAGGTVCATAPDRSDIGAYGGGNLTPGLLDDVDGDGFRPIDGDCDDNAASVNPLAVDLPGDFVDANCDGLEGCYIDADGDGFGNTGGYTVQSPFIDCVGTGVAPTTDDCDETDASVFPGASEGVADGTDQNCDGLEACWTDTDLDGFGHGSNTTSVSDPTCSTTGVAAVNTDCDDTNGQVYPGAVEVVADGLDQDCDGGDLCHADADGDSFGDAVLVVSSSDLDCADPGEADDATDCDDSDALVFPGGVEAVADGVDSDCDGGDLCFDDADGDGVGGVGTTASADLDCLDPGESVDDTDCDDADGTVFPGATEGPADGTDQDCDGTELCYQDVDGDTYGDQGGTTVVSADLVCTDAGESPNAMDCNDANPAVAPGAVEIAGDLQDQDCDGTELCFDDFDMDGQGTTGTHASPSLTCSGLADSFQNTDCDDTDPDVYLGAPEVVADGVDQDCDALEECWTDDDGDSYAGDLNTQTSADLTCSSGGLSAVVEDCDDTDPAINPGATEITADLVDQDCDGQEQCFEDLDQDGFGTTNTVLSADLSCATANQMSTLNSDCDDGQATTFPGAAEVVADGVDQDCDSTELCFEDLDSDGHGTTSTALSDPGDLACANPGVADVDNDCDDTDAAVFPGQVETPADGVDANCDAFEVCYRDDDDDGFGGTFTQVSTDLTCQSAGLSDTSDDCDDTDGSVYPGAPETPEDGIDQDCDGVDLEGCFEDLDGDGFGSSVVVYAPGDPYCSQAGRSVFQTDCDDSDSTIYPGAPGDVCDGIDGDCDGIGGPDSDEDQDQLTWTEELALGTDGCVADTDGDTILDGIEVDIASNPLSTDSDGDGADDGTEAGPVPAYPWDLDGDGIPNILDTDDDGDGLDTAYEDYAGLGPMLTDSDNDLIDDYVDVDDDGDSVDTIDEDDTIPNGDPTDDDCDGDGIPNYLDTDDDDDGVPTLEEENLGAERCLTDSDFDLVDDATEWFLGDSDGDNVPDIIDSDDDGDTIPSFDENYWPNRDVDGDGIPNYLDLNSDGDNRDDSVELDGDDDFDNIPNWVDPNDTDGGLSDADGDGLVTIDENAIYADPADPDSDDDGVDDGTEVNDIAAPRDSDGDTVLDVLDTDDDGDGIDTRIELGDECGDGSDVAVGFDASGPTLQLTFTCGDGSTLAVRSYRDTDLDSIPDYLDTDDDGDGVLTFAEDRNGNGIWTDDDLDQDGEPDWLDAFDQDGPAGDLDQDGLSNSEEQALGTDPYNADTDGDGMTDGDEGTGDTDGDGTIDALDEDDDGDGIPSSKEGLADRDGDGILDRYDDDSDGDGISDRDEGLGDEDCDGIANWADPDHSDSTCDAVDSKQEVIRWDGCDGCATGSQSPAGWLMLGVGALALARRRRE